MSENPLIVDERGGIGDGWVHTDSEHAANGGGVFYDFYATIQDGAHENWVGLGIDVAGDALSVLAFCEDPLQGLLSAGIGWLIEHVSFLSEPLDYLAGDPDLVQQKAQTWSNIKDALEKASQDYEQSAKALLQSYTGSAATAYGTAATNFANGVVTAASHADNAKNAMVVAAAIVGTTRGLVRDWISTFVAQAIEKAAIALATSVLDFGASIAVFIGDEVAEGAILADKTAAKLTDLANELRALASKAEQSASTAARAASSVGKDATKLSKSASSTLRKADDVGTTNMAAARAAAKDARKAGAYSSETSAALKANRNAEKNIDQVLDEVKGTKGALHDVSESGGPRIASDTESQARHVSSRLEHDIDKLTEQRRDVTGRRLHVPEEKYDPHLDLQERLKNAAIHSTEDGAKYAPVEGSRQGVTESQNREHELEEEQEQREELPDGSLVSDE